MNYLIDTNIFLILLEESFNRLSVKQRNVIFDPSSELFLSEASFFEIGIKSRLGKPDFSHFNLKTMDNDRKKANIRLIKSKTIHYLNIPNLPKVIKKDGKPHGDPFDLLIISQALVEKLPILSTYEYFPYYKGLNVI